MAAMSATSEEIDEVDPNQVYLRGRLAVEPFDRELPSGDTLSVFRLTVARPPGDRVSVDSLECTTTAARPRRALLRAQPGDLLEVTGSLRRRFWRSPNGPASRYAVEVATAKVIRPGRRGGASPVRKPASG